MLAILPEINYFNIVGFLVPTIVIFVMAGALADILILVIETKRLSLDAATTLMMYLIYFVLGNLLSRGLFIFSRIYLHNDFAYQEKVFYFYTAQKVSIGKLIGLALAVLIGAYLSGRIKDIYKYYDAFFLGLTATLFLRIGDALNHYHPGKITSPDWGVFYLGSYRHEPSLYEAVSLTVLLIFAWLVRKKIKKPGFLSLIILAWTSLSRFITDFFRNNDLPLKNVLYENSFYSTNYHLNSWLSLNQLVYLMIFIASLGVMIYILKTRGSIFQDPKID